MSRYFLLIMVIVLAAWGLTLDAGALDQGFLFWRQQGILLTGLLAVVLMGLLLVMATRPRWLEQRLGGLDHLYQLHKWSGITAGVAVILHWALEKSPRWLIDLGLLTLPPRQPRPPRVADPLRGIALEAGEIAFYVLIVFLIISLVRVLPYGRFRQIHKVGAVLFIAAAFHSAYLIPAELFWAPYGLLALTSSIAGSLAAIWLLFGQAGRMQRLTGSVDGFQQHAGDVLELEIALPQALPHYQAGQFAQLTLHKHEGAHPFTILHYDTERHIVRFAIKSLGDYTRKLASSLKRGDPVTFEGPYGRFVLPETVHQEIWIAGGIGITPFIAWLETLAKNGQQRGQARLYYCVNQISEAIFTERLRDLCLQTGVTLTILNKPQHGFLDPARLAVDNLTHVWFCGPEGMRNMLQKNLDIPTERMHFEMFEFR